MPNLVAGLDSSQRSRLCIDPARIEALGQVGEGMPAHARIGRAEISLQRAASLTTRLGGSGRAIWISVPAI